MPVGTAFREGHLATIHSDNPMTPIDPLRVIRTAILRIPRKGGDPMAPSERLSVDQAIRAMTTNAARQLGVETHRGSLEVGKAADIIMVSCDDFHSSAIYDPYSHLVYAARPTDVSDVFVNGERIVKNRQLSKVDAKILMQTFTETLRACR